MTHVLQVLFLSVFILQVHVVMHGEEPLDFNKHDINIFINETWQKYAGDYSKLQDVFFARITM